MPQAVAKKKVVVVGLGYVGLPLAVALANRHRAVGLDTDPERIDEIRRGVDRTGEIDGPLLVNSGLEVTADPAACKNADVIIVTVPTPVDQANRPDLSPLLGATRTVAALIDPARKPIIVYESTVYPGVTEDECGPLIERCAGLVRGHDFFLGYSPERINPGDREHRVDRIIKVIAGENPDVIEQLADLYGSITTGGVYRAASIRTAEAAKVIENAQRDINIAFMNEITQIFAKMGLSTLDVLDAASTKWNFLPFRPGLVGGHCIGVDPYYLSHCAQSLGHLPRVVLAGRSINDGMGAWVADSLHSHRASRAGHALILGATFKEDVPDLRNSRVIDLADRLRWLGHQVTLHDPVADPREIERAFGTTAPADALDRRYDMVVAAVGHRAYRDLPSHHIDRLIAADGLLADMHGIWRERDLGRSVDRWTF